MSHSHPATYTLHNFQLAPGSGIDADQVACMTISAGRITNLGTDLSEADNNSLIDMKGYLLSPGFIDLQLNGCGGVLFNSNISTQTLDTMHKCNLKSGCTAFLPTLITSSDEDIVRATDVVREYNRKHPDRVPGLHLEGPFINMDRRGIHDKQFVRPPTTEMINYICNNADVIAMITLAPEVCSEQTIRRLSDAGIVVSIGHSNATFDQVLAAETFGVSFATHLFNAMSPMTSREPGAVGAILGSDSLGAGIIADGHHLAWNSLKIAHKLLGERLVLVTDATPAAGSSIKEFQFGGQKVTHIKGKCINQNGTLGGSALTMDEAVRNCIHQGIDDLSAFQMATRNPAKVIGKTLDMGSIGTGQFANLTLLDAKYKVVGTISGGQCHFYDA